MGAWSPKEHVQNFNLSILSQPFLQCICVYIYIILFLLSLLLLLLLIISITNIIVIITLLLLLLFLLLWWWLLLYIIYCIYIKGFYRYSPPARPAESTTTTTTTTIKPLVVRKLGRCQMKIKWFYSQREWNWNSLRYFHCFANVPFPFPMQSQWLILCCIMLCFQIVVPLQTCCERARSARCVRQERATNRVWTVINIY